MKKKIVAFGEVVWDILPNEKVLGGTPSNLVFRCNSFGERGFLLSRVGDDELGNEAIEKLKELNISDDNVQLDTEFPTGTVHISFENDYDSRYVVTPDVAFDHIEFSAEALKLVRNANCLFYGLLPQRFGLSKNTLRELLKESPKSLHFFDLKLFEHFFDVKVVERLLNSSNLVRIKEKEIDFHLELDIESFERSNENFILITVIGTNSKDLSNKYETKVKIKKPICNNCSRSLGKRYDSIIQLRNSPIKTN